MNHLDIPILRTALNSAGEDARRVATNIRRDDYRTHRCGPGLPVTSALADALTQDRYGHSTIVDRFVASDRYTHPQARERAKTRLAWKTELSEALSRISQHDTEWRALIDAIANDTPIRLYQLGIDDELTEAA
jgi:hypothetical protein